MVFGKLLKPRRIVVEGFSKGCRSAAEDDSNNCRRSGSDWQQYVLITAKGFAKFRLRASSAATSTSRLAVVRRQQKYVITVLLTYKQRFLTHCFLIVGQLAPHQSYVQFSQAEQETSLAGAMGSAGKICTGGPYLRFIKPLLNARFCNKLQPF